MSHQGRVDSVQMKRTANWSSILIGHLKELFKRFDSFVNVTSLDHVVIALVLGPSPTTYIHPKCALTLRYQWNVGADHVLDWFLCGPLERKQGAEVRLCRLSRLRQQWLVKLDQRFQHQQSFFEERHRRAQKARQRLWTYNSPWAHLPGGRRPTSAKFFSPSNSVFSHQHGGLVIKVQIKICWLGSCFSLVVSVWRFITAESRLFLINSHISHQNE